VKTSRLALFLPVVWAILGISPESTALSKERRDTNFVPPATYKTEVEKIIESGFGRDFQWLNLGHWRPRGFVRSLYRSDFRSEADHSDFFFSPDGKNDPEDELRETLYAFARPLNPSEDEMKHPQCTFPARRRWAFEKFGWEKVLESHGVVIQPCLKRQAWKRQLDASGVSLVFAAAYLGNAASMFGHTFLKFHSKLSGAGRDLLDYGVNFSAETGNDGGVPFAVYGMMGRYPGNFSMQPFHETVKTYANVEGRDLIEYRLNLSQEEIDFFVDHLFELERTHFDYYFLTENCSYFLLAALEAAKPELKLSQSFFYQVIPADSIRRVAATPGLVREIKYRPSMATLFRASSGQRTPADGEFARRIVDSAEISESGAATKDFVDAALDSKIAEASTDALDLALDYGALRATSSSKFDKLNHKIRTERAKRGPSTSKENGAEKVTAVTRPEQGHDPGRLGLLVRSQTDNRRPKNPTTDLGFEFRFANHERLSQDDGYLRGTSLEVFRLKAFVEDTFQQNSRVRFEDATLLDIFSAQPIDAFSKPPSWAFAFGFREPPRAKSLGPYLRSGLGTTLALGRSFWITSLISGEVLSNSDIEHRWGAWLGPELVATLFLSPRWKWGFDAKLARAISSSRHYDVAKSELAFSATKNFEIRAAASYLNTEGIETTEWTLKAYQHFLF